MAYARGTQVDEAKSRAEIEQMLGKYGASRFGTLTDWEDRAALVEFTYDGLTIQMRIELPDQNDPKFKRSPTGRVKYGSDRQAQEYQAEVRRRWRCLTVAIKAKLVAIDEGVTTFEAEFMPYMLTDNGQTLIERMRPVLDSSRGNGRLMLPAPPESDVVDAEIVER